MADAGGSVPLTPDQSPRGSHGHTRGEGSSHKASPDVGGRSRGFPERPQEGSRSPSTVRQYLCRVGHSAVVLGHQRWGGPLRLTPPLLTFERATRSFYPGLPRDPGFPRGRTSFAPLCLSVPAATTRHNFPSELKIPGPPRPEARHATAVRTIDTLSSSLPRFFFLSIFGTGNQTQCHRTKRQSLAF